jgi:ribosome-binding protein aMBF1 (putative translation factor)
MARISDLHKRWMKDPAYRAEYEGLADAYGVIRARLAAGLTQEALAQRMGTKQTVIARLESGRAHPTIRTLERIAEATGHRLRIVLEPSDRAPTAAE